MMFGTVVRSIFNLYTIFSLELFDNFNYLLFIWDAMFSALFMRYEVIYIFSGKSNTKTREIWYKIMCLTNDFY